MTHDLIVDPEMARAMAPLLERGRAAFASYLDALPELSKPIGGATMRIVRENDFLENVELIMRFVQQTHATIYILDSFNDLACLMAPFTWRR